MANHEHDITRFSFTEEALEEGSPHLERFPGFLSDGPEHFGEHLLNGETYFNAVDTLIPVFKTKEGWRVLTGVRHNRDTISGELLRQGDVASAITIRKTHARARDLMNAYSQFRVPILGDKIEEEGYHLTRLDPRNPVLVADYEPGAQLEGEADDMLFSDFTNLIDKTQIRGFKDYPYGYSMIDHLFQNAKVWPGPTLVGISEVGTYFDKHRRAYPDIPLVMDPMQRDEAIPGGGRPIMEAHIFTSKMAVVDCSDLTDEEVRLHFPYTNEHYHHFDLAPIDQFVQAVKNGAVDLVAPNFRAVSLGSAEREKQYIMACARGMCLRTAAAGLARHVAYIRKMFGDEEPMNTQGFAYEDGLYRPPMKLTRLSTRTIIDPSNTY